MNNRSGAGNQRAGRRTDGWACLLLLSFLLVLLLLYIVSISLLLLLTYVNIY